MTAKSPKNKNAYTKLGKLSKDQKFSLHDSNFKPNISNFFFHSCGFSRSINTCSQLEKGHFFNPGLLLAK